jgi:glyoxylase-like metal-dependent hydrolase (beta-lactamase superfamily II)
MKAGNIEITPIEYGRFKLDGGAMFGVVPKPLWERVALPDDENRIDMATRGMLIRAGARKILVDTGIGDKMSEKLNRIYAVDFSRFSLENSLKQVGLSYEDITDVILTHLHFDHTGGSTKIDDDENVIPTFPNATYWLQRQQYDWALSPSDRDRASFMPVNYVPLYEKGCLELLEGERELFPGISVIPVHGHTFGQQLIKVADGSEAVLFCADLCPTAAHIPLPYIMGYDLQPLVTLEEKKNILPRVVEEEWTVFFEHDPNIIMAKVEKTDKGFKLAEELMVVDG